LGPFPVFEDDLIATGKDLKYETTSVSKFIRAFFSEGNK